MQDVAAVVGKDLFTDELRETLGQFEQAKNFGSLIVPKLRDPAETLRVVEARDFGGDLLLKEVQARVVAVLRMAEALSPKYHVVVANPPYMGAGSMDQKLKSWVQARYTTSKSDLFAMFMVRAGELVKRGGWNALVTMEAWMFLTSYSKLRAELMAKVTIQNLLHLPYEGRSPTAMGIAFGVAAFILRTGPIAHDRGTYNRLRYFELKRDGTPQEVAAMKSNAVKKAQRSFQRIPGQTVAFDASDRLISLFGLPRTSESHESGGRCKTSNDELYLRRSWEVSATEVGLKNNWCLLSKGGEFRKYFGNVDTVMRWSADAKKAYSSSGGLTRPEFWEKSGITWTIVSSKGAYSFRLKDAGTQYNSVSPTIFGPNQKVALSYLNSKVASAALKVIAPTLAANVGEVLNLPFQNPFNETIEENAGKLLELGRSDWDAYETSWDFTTLPLLSPDHRAETLEDTYTTLRTHWQGMTDEMQRLEEENNRIFIDAYGLQDELTPEVPLNEITLTCNPAYRYGIKTRRRPRDPPARRHHGRVPLLRRGLHVRPLQPRRARPDPRQSGRDAGRLPRPHPEPTSCRTKTTSSPCSTPTGSRRHHRTLPPVPAHHLRRGAFPREPALYRGRAWQGHPQVLHQGFLRRPREALQETPDLLDVLQPQGHVQRADLHAPVSKRHGVGPAQRLPARVHQQAGGRTRAI